MSSPTPANEMEGLQRGSLRIQERQHLRNSLSHCLGNGLEVKIEKCPEGIVNNNEVDVGQCQVAVPGFENPVPNMSLGGSVLESMDYDLRELPRVKVTGEEGRHVLVFYFLGEIRIQSIAEKPQETLEFTKV